MAHDTLRNSVAPQVTPLCTQLVYSGLIDEIFGMAAGFCELGADITGDEKATKVRMHAGYDEVYGEIRDINFSEVPGRLKARAKGIGAEYHERHGATEISQMKQFVKKLGGLQSQHRNLQNHTYAAEKVLQAKNNDEMTRQLEAEHSCLAGEDQAGGLRPKLQQPPFGQARRWRC